MKNEEYKKLNIDSKILDFLVLGITFYVTCSILSIHADNQILLLTVVYPSVILVSVKIGKYMLSPVFSSLNTVVKLMLDNAAGLFIGTIIMLILGFIIPSFSNFSVVIIIASVMAFFVLGTLSPLIRPDKRVRR
jgi:hypothetical protein